MSPGRRMVTLSMMMSVLSDDVTIFAETALHLAASCGCHELVTLLVRSGSAVDAEDENLSTPLMLASLGGHPHCVHELVLAGADVTRRNINDVRQTSWINVLLLYNLSGHRLQSGSETWSKERPNGFGESHVVNNQWSEGALILMASCLSQYKHH